MISPTTNPTRNAEDFAWHVHKAVQADPRVGWGFVLDNLNAALQGDYGGLRGGFGEVRLQVGPTSGDRSTLDTNPPVTPLASPFANSVQLEPEYWHPPDRNRHMSEPERNCFRHREAIRCGNFKSLQGLEDRLLGFITCFNKTYAKQFQWNYTGRHIPKT